MRKNPSLRGFLRHCWDHYAFVLALTLTWAVCDLVAYADDVRVVDGKAYNVRKSTNWVHFPMPAKVPVYMQVVRVTRFGVVGQYYGRDQFGGKELGEKFVVKNHPGQDTLTSGKLLAPFWAMRVGRLEVDGETLAWFDHGKASK